MPQRHVDAALDLLVEALRAHLTAVVQAYEAASPTASPRPKAAPDDEAVWRAYIALNNAAHEYDVALNERYGEVTPFDLEPITEEEGDSLRTADLAVTALSERDDPYPRVVSVRQRRDYRVPSVAALLRVAELGRPAPAEGESYEPIRTVGDAVIELLQSGDGSLGMLDLPELEPLDGVVVVAEVEAPLPDDSLAGLGEAESDQPFRLGPGDAVLSRLHESALSEEQVGPQR